MNKGQKITVLNNRGEKISATMICLSYKKEPRHWAIEITKPHSGKLGFKRVVQYLPANRIVA